MMFTRSNRPSSAIVGNLSVRGGGGGEEEGGEVSREKEWWKIRARSGEEKGKRKRGGRRRREKDSGIRRSIYFTRLSEKGQQFRRIKREQRKLAALKKHNRPRHISLISKKTRQKNRMAGMLSRTHHVLSSKNPCSSQSEGSGEASRRHRVTVNKSVRHAIRSRGLLDVGGRRKMFDQWITVNSSSELLG